MSRGLSTAAIQLCREQSAKLAWERGLSVVEGVTMCVSRVELL